MNIGLIRRVRDDGRGRRRLALLAVAVALAGAPVMAPSVIVTTADAAVAPEGQGFTLNLSDIRFIKRQVDIAERHAATRSLANPCGTLLGTAPDQIPNGNQSGTTLPWGLRTVDGTCNNLIPGQEEFGAADTIFPRLVPRNLRGAYQQKKGTVVDSQPREISNLIVDQTVDNPAAREAAGGVEAVPDGQGLFSIPNVAPDVGLSAPFNSFFTLFGQFFDHGLDLVTKGGGTVFMPLQPGDPLYDPSSPTNFMVLTRATNQPGPDRVAGDRPPTTAPATVCTAANTPAGCDESIDDVQEHTNTTTAFVDQNQTYTSHPAHQAFLREYVLDAGSPADTGRLLGGVGGEGLATWGDIKAEALAKLGVVLTDQDVLNVPMLATDPYGNLELSAGRPQLVTASGLVSTVPGGTTLPADVVRTGHAFLDDIAHHAAPNAGLVADADTDSVADDNNSTTYDDEMLESHFVAGDGRANENIGLTTVHHIFHSEHNRLVADIDSLIATETAGNFDAWHSTSGPAGWDYGQRVFQAARFVTEMEYQHLVFEEFARKVQPMVNVFGEGGTGYRTTIDPAIRAEFAHAVYRFGHSMLTETVARTNADGTDNSIGLIDAFLDPQAFVDGGAAGTLTPDEAAGSVVRGTTRDVGNQIDEFVIPALRNNLLGLPLDLATINMARARDTGIPRLNEARRAFYDASNNSALTPYESWADFSFALRTPASLVNFIAAYGTHDDVVNATGTTAKRQAAQALLDLAGQPFVDPVVTPQDAQTNAAIQDAYDFVNGSGPWANAGGRTITGVDDIDLWVGGLAEKPMVFGGMLGATFNYVFEAQLEDLQDGDRFYYLSRTAGLNLLTQLEGNSFAELTMRNTDVEGLPADAFSRPDFIFDVSALGTTGPIPDDPATADYNESLLLTRMANGTIRFGGGEHVVFNGTSGPDKVWSSEGDDTIRGNDGNDWMQGGDGNDNHIGGLGNDILLDLAGDDTLKGGQGNDALSSGQGFGGDLNQGGLGKDFIVGGNDITETFAGPGDDFVFAGDAEDTVFGDDGDDWIEDGKGPFSLLQGDNGAPFQDDPNEPGHDVLNGDGGEQDYDAEGGDDVMMEGPGIQRNEGMLGFDWATHKGDPIAGDSDMAFTGLLPPGVETNRDRFDLVEGLSGWQFNDVLRGDDRAAADLGTEHQLTPAGFARISGLTLPGGATTFNGGNIIVGGAGNDEMEGRGGDDILDGDSWLNARLSVRSPVNPNQEIGSADGMRTTYLPAPSTTTLQQAVFDGTVDPGNIVIVREMLDGGQTGDVDTAVFTGPRADYTIATAAGWTTVTDNVGTDGVDRVRNVERLQFADGVVELEVPLQVVTTPANNAVNVSPSANLTGTFNRDVTSINWTAAVQLRNAAGTLVARTVTYDAATRTVTINPNANLAPGASYTLTFLGTSANGIRDLNGVPLPTRVVSFVTAGDPAPTVTTNPVNGAVNVSATANQTGTFNRDVTSPNWANAVQLRNAAGTLVGRTVTYNAVTRTVTINPNANLAPGESYTLRFLGTGVNGIRDLNGVRLTTTNVAFTTASDSTPPAVTTSTPANNATGVAPAASVTVNFSEQITGVSAATVVLENIANPATPVEVATTVTLSPAGTRITVNPTPNLTLNTLYRVRLTEGITDTAGNPLAATTVTFRIRP